MTGRDSNPTCAISAKDSCDPNTTTDSCNTNLLAVFTPGVNRALGRRNVEISTPMMIAVTGAPINGMNRAATVATMAIPTERTRPGIFAAKAVEGVAASDSLEVDTPPCWATPGISGRRNFLSRHNETLSPRWAKGFVDHDLHPMPLREIREREDVRAGVVEHRSDLRVGARQHPVTSSNWLITCSRSVWANIVRMTEATTAPLFFGIRPRTLRWKWTQ